jgi:uroporphyrinogen-III synthase
MRVPLQPLEGYTVGVTADRRASEQAELLRRRGARVLDGPTIATAYLASDERLRAATTALVTEPPTVLVVTTGIGIRAWIEAAQSWGLDQTLLDVLAGTRIVARGPKAALGLDVAATAPDERMTGVRELLDDLEPGAHVAIQCFGDDTREVDSLLRRPDVRVTTVPVYRWHTPTDTRPAQLLVRAVLDGRVDAVTFTSAPAVRNLFAIADADGVSGELLDTMNAKTVAACVGPACADAALALGIQDPIAPTVGRLGLMVRLLSERLHASRAVLELGGTRVEVQGQAMLVGDEHVQLTRREAEVFAVLAARMGVVVSPATLLRTVWGGASADEHVVGVTVGRLRRKLGGSGAAVRTVPRRGYRLDVASPAD